MSGHCDVVIFFTSAVALVSGVVGSHSYMAFSVSEPVVCGGVIRRKEKGGVRYHSKVCCC